MFYGIIMFPFKVPIVLVGRLLLLAKGYTAMQLSLLILVRRWLLLGAGVFCGLFGSMYLDI